MVLDMYLSHMISLSMSNQTEIPPKKPSHIGEAIRLFRYENGMTQADLAEEMGLGRNRFPYISLVEAGGHINMTLERLRQFATALNCQPQHLLDAISSNIEEQL